MPVSQIAQIFVVSMPYSQALRTILAPRRQEPKKTISFFLGDLCGLCAKGSFFVLFVSFVVNAAPR
jgi:hypothetical protein